MPRHHKKEPKLIANLGDESPFEHGGYFIYDEGNGTYTGHYWDNPDNEDEPTEVFRFDIPKDVFDDFSWADQKGIASYVGSTAKKLEREGRSSDVRKRAWVMRDVGSYNGFNNLDSYPVQFTQRELETKYEHDYDMLCRREARTRYDPQLQLDLEPDEDE